MHSGLAEGVDQHNFRSGVISILTCEVPAVHTNAVKVIRTHSERTHIKRIRKHTHVGGFTIKYIFMLIIYYRNDQESMHSRYLLRPQPRNLEAAS